MPMTFRSNGNAPWPGMLVLLNPIATTQIGDGVLETVPVIAVLMMAVDVSPYHAPNHSYSNQRIPINQSMALLTTNCKGFAPGANAYAWM